MNLIISIVLIAIFLFLSSIHIYWGVGGKWVSGAVIPTKDDNTKIIMPGVIPTFIVAFGLLSFAMVIFLNIDQLYFKLPHWILQIQKYGLWAIMIIFILRAIGDFHYVGFFKKYKQTKFGQNDTKYYSPLCFLIGILTLILVLNK